MLDEYTSRPQHDGQPPTRHPSKPKASIQEYALSFPDGYTKLLADPHWVDNCTGTGIDEASTEGEENCHFKVIHGKVMIVATRTIEPGEQLLTRYGYQYWMDSKWPLALLQIMFTKYRGIKPDGLTNK